VESFSKPQHTLRANKYRMLLEKQNKKALDPNDNKTKVLKNMVNTAPWEFNSLKLKAIIHEVRLQVSKL